MNTAYFICHRHELFDNQPRGFTLEVQQQTLELFLLKTAQKILAYRNLCPHLAIPLNWQPDVFLSADGNYIQCATHGALFNPEDGLCVAGPCSGQSLQKLTIELRSDEIWLQWDNRVPII